MKINISKEMTQAVVAALRLHVERHGEQAFGSKLFGVGSKGDLGSLEDYQVSNVEALEFFETVLRMNRLPEFMRQKGLAK